MATDEPASPLTLAAALVAGVLSQAQPVQVFNVPPGEGLASLNRLAAQADLDLVVEADLRGRRSAAVRGRMTASEALDRLLGPIGARAVRLSDRLYRVERVPRVSASTRSPAVRHLPPPVEPTVLEEVVVTGPVRRGGLDGANGRVPIDTEALERVRGAHGADALADLSAAVDSTRQGPGRNKLFIRGVADSAFNGPLQATVGQYLGDLRLNYGSPDPDLALVDIERIEVFEGPQGSRFGSGSIGGVVRWLPAAPERGVEALDVAASAAAAAGGAPGADASLVMNRPVGDAATVRLVVYGRRDGGFLDNPVRGVRNADRIDTVGVRATARVVEADWTLDATALAQQISSGDAQTISVAASDPIKTRAVAEPYDSGVALLGLSAHRRLSHGRFTWAASLSRQALNERLEATSPTDPAPSVVDRSQRITALSAEARVEWSDGGLWSWNGGAAFAAGRTEDERRRGAPQDPSPHPQTALARRFVEGALFLEGVASPTPRLAVAFGGRLSLGHATHVLWTDGGRAAAADPPAVDQAEFSPTAAVRWRLSESATLFARLERGVRPGGVSEARGAVQPLRGDRVALLETGVRWVGLSRDWSAEASLGWLDWTDIQADLATQGGDLVTTNVGNGEVRFVQLKAAWRPTDALSLSGGLFVNDSRLKVEGLNTIGIDEGEIPNVARTGVQFSVLHEPGSLLGSPVSFAADLRYVGRSRPGLGPGLEGPQGDYWQTALTARWGDAGRALVLRLSNPQDRQGVRYGIGSPYQLADPQGAPLRPLTLRVGFEASF